MRAEEQEKQICALLTGRDFLPTGEIAERIGASEATARRVVNRLAENRMLLRVHGGVRPLPPESNPSIPFGLREQWFSREKQLLAAEAAKLIPREGVLFVHGGSTTTCLGNYISGGSVITNSLRLAELLRERFPTDDGPEVIVPGGTLDRKAGILTGTRAERAIGCYHADAVFFSARGIDAEGVLDTSDATAGVARAMIEHARLAVMIADHSKFSGDGMTRMVHWSQVDVLITTDRPDSRPLLEAIRRQGVKVIAVECPETLFSK